MAELLIVVVVAGLVLLYAADRARKLRARARQMSAMNDRLDVAAAKVDEQQERKRARVRASAELTSVMPAIKRPPLSLPGVPGPGTEPDEDAELAGGVPGAQPAAEAAPATQAGPAAAAAAGSPATTAAAGSPAMAAPADPDADPAADAAPPASGTPAAAAAAGSPVLADEMPADEAPADQPPAGDVPAAAGLSPEGTLTMDEVVPHAAPVPRLQVTFDGTLIMPAVPGQEPAPPAGPAVPPQSRARPRSRQPRPGQPRTGQPRTSQPRTSQPRTSQPPASQEQSNRH